MKTGWVTELKNANNNFETLVKERYSEEAGKTHLSMKEVREQIDAAYHTITERIGALIIVNGEETYSGFVKDLNRRVEKYYRVLSQREGRNSKKGNGEEE
ncbi:DUF6261 family protein [Maribellus maritimus]|uniref:DUF6261 family protein n=1 Tax=Maribellus maritimus TaxID=2870838 RepID=UPI001EEB4D79|nr:DUF6261 family protein [Maribellus maritimus]MCG6191387.1 hypothetical protein [Maribellus maritimus]